MRPRRPSCFHQEEGMALLISVNILLLISAIGLSALQSATGEASAGGRSARKLTSFYAADGVLGAISDQLNSGSQYPDTTSFTDPNFTQNGFGGAIQVQTGTAESAVPQPIRLVGRTRREGDQLNINSGGSFSFGIYRVDAAATDPVGGRVELQAQYSVAEGSDTYR